jgi:hypothetical protein
MKKRTYVMYAAIVLITVVAVVFLVLGITQHKESGLMRACLNEGSGYYNYDGDCFDVRMDGHGPFEVDIYLDPQIEPAMNYRRILRAALGNINRRLGRELLLVGDLTDRSCSGGTHICYSPESLPGPEWLDAEGSARHFRMGEAAVPPIICEVTTSNTGDEEMELLVLEHELGHCLGLAHDDFELSIMRRVQTPTPQGEMGPWITDHDRDLLRETYR